MEDKRKSSDIDKDGSGERDGKGDAQCRTPRSSSVREEVCKSVTLRISRLVRSLTRPESQEDFMTSINLIKIQLNKQDNRKYVQKSFAHLAVALGDALRSGNIPRYWREEGIKAMAELIVAFVNAMDHHSNRLYQWILDYIMKNSHSHGTLSTDVLFEMVELLEPKQISILGNELYSAIEEAEVISSFKPLAALIVSCLERSPDSPHFQDFVDLVIGWMVDESVVEDSSEFCSKLILLLKNHFLKDTSFPRTLLSQILEDMDTALITLLSNTSNELALKRVILLSKAYLAILKTDCFSNKAFVTESTERLVAATLQTLQGVSLERKSRVMLESLLVTTNDVISLTPGVNGPFTTEFIRTEIEWFKSPDDWGRWSSYLFTEVWNGICTWVENAVAVTQITDETLEICDILMGIADNLMMKRLVEPIIVTLIHALFRSRNVTLLQKVYMWHLLKINGNVSKDKNITLFFVAGLADIAVNRSGSILSLYALKPSICELLLDLAGQEKNVKVKSCVLNLLRGHCSIHSHFLSSLATTGTFGSDSPGLRFLPFLMDYWIKELESEEDTNLIKLGIWEWLTEFLQLASSYAHLLFQTKGNFFSQLLKIIFIKIRTRTNKEERILLMALIKDRNYVQIESIKSLIESECMKLMEVNSKRENKELVFEILKNVRDATMYSETNDFEEEKEHQNTIFPLDRDYGYLTQTEFSSFLYQLLVCDASKSLSLDDSVVKSAVNHLIRSKLRTPLGKPQELFGQIQNILKKKGCPKWKLDFVYGLERAFQLLIYGSSLTENTAPQQIQSFYSTNKGPCMEWLKRIRIELIDRGLDIGDFPMAFYNASMAGNVPKASLALLELQDSEGVKGMKNSAGWHYLQGNFELALELLKKETVEESPLKNIVEERAALILSTHLRRKDLLEPLNQVLGKTSLPNFLLQVEMMNSKTSLNRLKEDKLDLWQLLTVCHRMRNDEIDGNELEILTAKNMLKQGNVQFVQEWLAMKGIDWRVIEKKESFPSAQFIQSNQVLLEMTAELCLMKKESETAAWIYKELLEQVECYSSKAELLLKIVKKLRSYPEATILREIPCLFEGNKGEKLECLYEKALHMSPSLKSAWLAYGDFNYDYPEWDDDRNRKNTAVECYSSYLRLDGIEDMEGTKSVTALVISRLIKLFVEGYVFEPEEVIVSKDWVNFLPQMAQIPALRIHMLRKFPRETSFALLSSDSTQHDVLPPLRRKGLFDPTAFSILEVSDESWSASPTVTNGCSCIAKDKGSSYVFRSELNISEELKMFGRELLRLGTSSEEMWAWNLQRVLVDWNKRVNALKRDLARDPDPSKVKTYVQPVQTFLKGLWDWTKQKAESPSELAFLHRTEVLPKLIEAIGNCTSVEALTTSFDKLLFFADGFESYLSSKCPLSHLSPKLASMQCQEGIIPIPGLPPNVSVMCMEGTVYSLATKTRPKKIRFRGSDGKRYEYLVKGNENLNIDSAVMQCLTLMGKVMDLEFWTYAVTPLGKRGGLIRMVEGAVPVFQLYKKYLQRNNCAERTSEMFWRRMDAHGASDRGKVDVLKQVFTSLVSDTPKELISREIFLSANDPMEWYSAVKMFTRDCGRSSAIGYLLGIGDRHLDNMLVNSKAGKLIHVDFSLMFNKGSSLPVPECVPFRLTQNLISALQFPGPEGAFEVHMEQSLDKLHREEEFLIFCARTIAFACQLEEDCPVSPVGIRCAEVNASLAIFKFRYMNIWKSAQQVIEDIKTLCLQLDSQILSVKDCEIKITSCENNIEKLTVALGTLKEFQSDFKRLSELRTRCCSHSSILNREDMTETEAMLAYLTENFVRKCVLTDNDIQWALSMEKLITSQLQGEVQTKFSLSDELGRLKKHEGDALTKLQRKINRWRRMIANIDPLITFIHMNTIANSIQGSLSYFKILVETQWMPVVAHFWLHSSVPQLVDSRSKFPSQFDLVELTLDQMAQACDTIWISEEEESRNKNFHLDIIHYDKIEYLVQFTKGRIGGFNSTFSVKSLVEEATSVDNLARMYEGWCPWV